MIVSDSRGSGERFLIPQGPQYAICIGVTDVGTQPSANPDIPARRKVVLSWLLPDLEHVFSEEIGPEPAEISRFFTASLDERGHLRPFLEMWRGKAFDANELEGFDTAKLLGVAATLQIIHKGDQDKKAIVNGCMLAKKRQDLPSNPQTWHFDFDRSDEGDFDCTPEWLQNIAKKSPEFAAWKLDADIVTNDEVSHLKEAVTVPGADDDIPF